MKLYEWESWPRRAHSYRWLVPLAVFLAARGLQAGVGVGGGAGQLALEQPSQTQQRRAQEHVPPLGLRAGRPEPAHGQQGAQGAGGRAVPPEEPRRSAEVEARPRGGVPVAERDRDGRRHGRLIPACRRLLVLPFGPHSWASHRVPLTWCSLLSADWADGGPHGANHSDCSKPRLFA